MGAVIRCLGHGAFLDSGGLDFLIFTSVTDCYIVDSIFYSTFWRFLYTERAQLRNYYAPQTASLAVRGTPIHNIARPFQAVCRRKK
jgi:hypothetical protein